MTVTTFKNQRYLLNQFFQKIEIKNQRKYNTTNKTQKHLLYKQFIAWHCDGYPIVPITNCIKNPIFQELPGEKKLFIKFDERDSRLSKNYRKAIRNKY